MIITEQQANRNDFAFISLVDCKEKFPDVKAAYLSVFGEQNQVIEDIQKRTDRKTEILTHNGKSVGVVVYKRELSRTDDSLELTLVSLFDKEDEKKGYRSKLFERIDAVAKELRAASICHTLPSTAKELISYFTHKGYQSQPRREEVVLTRVFEQKRRKVEEKPVREVTLKEPYLSQIISGQKTIEGRINSGQFSHYKVGDVVKFFNNSKQVLCTVTKIESYVGFKEMLQATDYRKCIPSANSLDKAFEAYASIHGFLDRAKKNGVLAFHISVNK